MSIAPILFAAASAPAVEYALTSPGGNLKVTVDHYVDGGTLAYRIESGGVPVVDRSPLGILTSRGGFTGGMSLEGAAETLVDETYAMPSGKRSLCVNRARELTLRLSKGGQAFHLVFRAYDEGAAWRYVLPGTGNVDITGESTGISLSGGDIRYWGQAHPNNYGYESPLGPVTAERLSVPVLARLGERDHYVFVAQAASYGHYILPHFRRQGSALGVAFPMDQKGPVRTTLPFASPWRVVMASPGHPGRILESTMLENLNPPAEAGLAGAPWIRAGKASWDFIAGDGADLRKWIDFGERMRWQYHVADAGWEGRVPDMAGATAYGKSKGIGVIVWGKVANKTTLNTPERAEAWMAKLEGLGIAGAKIDFFDQADITGAKTDDLEDTQGRLQVRDFLSEIAIRHHLVMEYHGCAVPSGERRRWPHLLAAEGVYGMERRTQLVSNDLTIPFIRNLMGPVSFTPIHMERSAGSHAYQLGQVVLYETGVQIFADRHDRILAFPGADFLRSVPAAWDDTRFLAGEPASHLLMARRKGSHWWVGALSAQARTLQVTLDFLEPGVAYRAVLWRDGTSRTNLVREERTVTSRDVLSLATLAAGGFAVEIRHPNPQVTIVPRGFAPRTRDFRTWDALGRTGRLQGIFRKPTKAIF